MTNVKIILSELKYSLDELFHPATISKNRSENITDTEQIDFNKIVTLTTKVLRKKLSYKKIAQKLNAVDNSLNLPINDSSDKKTKTSTQISNIPSTQKKKATEETLITTESKEMN